MPNNKSICVLTYALVPGGWVQSFISHYKRYTDGLIYIMCDQNLANHADFQDERVKILPLRSHEYKERLVIQMYEKILSSLLKIYSAVIIADIDEFFVPYAYDSSNNIIETDFLSLLSKLESNISAVRSLGINLVQMPHEKDIDISKEIISQRSIGHLVTPMNKIAIILKPCKLDVGKHFADQICPIKPINYNYDKIENHYILINYHLHHACKSTRTRIEQLQENAPIAAKGAGTAGKKNPNTLVENMLKKDETPIYSLFSPEVESWISEFNSQLIRAIPHPQDQIIRIKHYRSNFFIELPITEKY